MLTYFTYVLTYVNLYLTLCLTYVLLMFKFILYLCLTYASTRLHEANLFLHFLRFSRTCILSPIIIVQIIGHNCPPHFVQLWYKTEKLTKIITLH